MASVTSFCRYDGNDFEDINWRKPKSGPSHSGRDHYFPSPAVVVSHPGVRFSFGFRDSDFGIQLQFLNSGGVGEKNL